MKINSTTNLKFNNLKNNESVKIKIQENDNKIENEVVSSTVVNKDNVENETNNKRNDVLLLNDQFEGADKEEKIKEAIEIINKLLKKRNSRIEVENHEFFKSDLMMKIIDEDTGDVIVEVPPKKILDMIATMVKMAEGIVIDKKA
ncbi:flagellar protein FlaG [Oceanirhabdus sp. W0125-5]|uniref:flagellar protein FlaG n=1 Tax=Oceanirhabdus sp. W0125-5 TaxID=2999116 RepID=UPI0022F2C2CE|nr:flagellar protein FlaG [Oceanirhabdus sp. W0125-5]WBW95468.1 flagellar protein FlaG [Oceanirhabdus sp. W0125-5]